MHRLQELLGVVSEVIPNTRVLSPISKQLEGFFKPILDVNVWKSVETFELSKALFSLDPDSIQLYCVLGLRTLFC